MWIQLAIFTTTRQKILNENIGKIYALLKKISQKYIRKEQQNLYPDKEYKTQLIIYL